MRETCKEEATKNRFRNWDKIMDLQGHQASEHLCHVIQTMAFGVAEPGSACQCVPDWGGQLGDCVECRAFLLKVTLHLWGSKINSPKQSSL